MMVATEVTLKIPKVLAQGKHVGKPRKPYDVFLSHAGYGAQKQSIVSMVYDELKKRKINAFLDRDSLKSGEMSGPEIVRAAATAKIVVVFLSPEYISRVWTLKELEIALARGNDKPPRQESACKFRQGQTFLQFLEGRFSQDELILIKDIDPENGVSGEVLPLFFAMTPQDCSQLVDFVQNHDTLKEHFEQWSTCSEGYCTRWQVALTELHKIAGPEYVERSETYQDYATRVADIIIQKFPTKVHHFVAITVFLLIAVIGVILGAILRTRDDQVQDSLQTSSPPIENSNSPTPDPSPGLSINNELGNGSCDVFFNTPEFNYDGGDCCESTCKSRAFLCGKDQTGYADVAYFFCHEKPVGFWKQDSEPVVLRQLDNDEVPDYPFWYKSPLELSDNGKILAIGEPFSRRVRLYDKDGSEWVERATLEGPEGYMFGWSIALAVGEFTKAANNPSALIEAVIAVGAVSGRTWDRERSGIVRVYHCDVYGCKQIGGDLTYERPLGDGSSASFFGHAVAISRKGRVVAVGVPDTNFGRGAVVVFQWLGGASGWVRRGPILEYNSSFPPEFLGYYVSLSADGDTLAFGSRDWAFHPKYRLINQVVSWNGTNWLEKGSAVETTGDFPSGWSIWRLMLDRWNQTNVSLSDDGTVLAVESLCDKGTSDTLGNRCVYVRSWNGSVWTENGGAIFGNDNAKYVHWSMSRDGTSIAMATWTQASGDPNSAVLTFQWNGTDYHQLGDKIPCRSATSISLSGEGSALAVSSFYLEQSVPETSTVTYATAPDPNRGDNSSLFRLSMSTSNMQLISAVMSQPPERTRMTKNPLQ